MRYQYPDIAAMLADQTLDITAMGFWLPCGQANFIRHHADHRLCVQHEFSPEDILQKDLAWRQQRKLEGIDVDDSDIDDEVSAETEALQSSIYRRLITVLSHKGYTKAYGITPDGDDSFNDEDIDPRAVLLFTQTFDPADWPKEDDPHWPDDITPEEQRVDNDTMGHAVKAIALLVNAQGFYVWLVVHEKREPTPGYASPSLAIRLALRRHIERLAGGDFYSHISKPPAHDTESAPSAQSLKEYRDEHLGFLPFFQLNAILEGLSSYTFDPRIFFQTRQEDEEKIKKSYSIGKFIGRIVTETAVGSDAQKTVTPPAFPASPSSQPAQPAQAQSSQPAQPELETLPTTKKRETAPTREAAPTKAELITWILALAGTTPATPQDNVDFARRVGKHCLNNQVRRDLLRQFIRKVTVFTLQTMKWRIERTRRALLAEVIEITHRQEPLEQIESPEQADYIEDVNEAQLRGYVMLFAAKFPILMNVDLYLKDAVQSIEISGTTPAERELQYAVYLKPLDAFKNAWSALMKGIDDNIRGLERAVEQARMDQMVYEEQQIRAVQETLGEIDRIRERSDASLSPTSNLAVNILASVLAAVAVTVSFINVLRYLPVTLPVISWGIITHSWSNDLWIAVIFIMLILLLILVNFIVQKLLDRLLWIYFVLRRIPTRQSKRRNERLYYEMDVHLDRSIPLAKSQIIFDASFDKADKRDRGRFPRRIYITEGAREKWFLGMKPRIIEYSPLERKSYRTERVSDNEAAHKIYIETTVRWWRRWSPMRFIFPDMEIFLVYEVLFHRPGGQHSYALQDLRVISTYDWNLHGKDISAFKALIIEDFINPLIDKPLSEKDALNTISPAIQVKFDKEKKKRNMELTT